LLTFLTIDDAHKALEPSRSSLLIDVFKMTNANAGAAYDLGVKIFGRAGCLQTMG
jgi:hypothetical protein